MHSLVDLRSALKLTSFGVDHLISFLAQLDENDRNIKLGVEKKRKTSSLFVMDKGLTILYADLTIPALDECLGADLNMDLQ